MAGRLKVWNDAAGEWQYVNAASGGSSTHTWQSFRGASEPLPGTGTGAFDFSTGATVHGDTLLDLTDPALPTFIEEGVYAISFTAGPDSGAGASGDFFTVLVSIQQTGVVPIYQSTPMDVPNPMGGPLGWTGITAYVEAGTAFYLAVLHNIGSDTSFDFNVFIQRLQ